MTSNESRVIVFRNGAPVSREELLSDPTKVKLAEPLLQFFDISDPLELAGEWWGVIHPAAREFHGCIDEESAIALGMQIAQKAHAELWREGDRHGHGRLIADYTFAHE